MAARAEDPATREQVVPAYHAPVPDAHTLFALDVERVLYTAYRFRGDRPPANPRWPEPREA